MKQAFFAMPVASLFGIIPIIPNVSRNLLLKRWSPRVGESL